MINVDAKSCILNIHMLSQQNDIPSSGKVPVSTVLLTKNSIAGLPKYLESMRMIDDIVVIDGGSTDGTLELLRAQPNCRVYPQNPAYLDEHGYIVDFSSIRNEGYELAKHPWILCIDADEAATPELLAEVREIVKNGTPGVYYVQRTFVIDGKPIVSIATSDHVRLFHRSAVRGCVKPVHERLDVLPGAYRGKLKQVVFVPLQPASTMRKKYDRYLNIEIRANKNMTLLRWFRWYLLRNTFSIIRRCLVILFMRLLPKPGPRYPLSLEWEQIRYLIVLTAKTFPVLS